MRKIPSMFERDWQGDRSQVLNKIVAGCEWVQAGVGIATRKYDGTACLWRHDRLWRRYDAKTGRVPPPGFEPAQPAPDPETGHWPGWILVGEGPEDCWHRLALTQRVLMVEEQTYELVGPHVAGNPEGFAELRLVPHGAVILDVTDRTYAGLRDCIGMLRIEGIVFHHGPEGVMAKVKARDLGLPWPVIARWAKARMR